MTTPSVIPVTPILKPNYPMTLIQAIAMEEGYYVLGSRPRRNWNPGDLEFHEWMQTYGSIGGDPRFAIFPGEIQGFAALRHLLGFTMYKGKTIAQAIYQFAPGNQNDTASYIRNVCAFCEVGSDTVIDGILG